MAASLRAVTSSRVLCPSIVGASLNGDGAPILCAIRSLLVSPSSSSAPSPGEGNTIRAATASSAGYGAPIMSAIRALISSSSSAPKGEGTAVFAATASSAGDGAPIMSAIRSLVGASSLSASNPGEGTAICAASCSAGEGAPILSDLGFTFTFELCSFSVLQGSAYGFRDLVPALCCSFRPCKVLPVALTSNRKAFMLVNILLGAFFGGYVLASTDGQPGSCVLKNLKEKLERIEAEIRELERMIEACEDAELFTLIKEKIDRLKEQKENLETLIEDILEVEEQLRKIREEAATDKEEAKVKLAAIGRKMMEKESGLPKDKLWRKLLASGLLLVLAPKSTIAFSSTIDDGIIGLIALSVVGISGLLLLIGNSKELWEEKVKSLRKGVEKLLGKSPGRAKCYKCNIELPSVCCHCGSELPDFLPPPWRDPPEADSPEEEDIAQ